MIWLSLLAVLLPVLVGCAGADLRQSMPSRNPPPFSDSGQDLVAERWWIAFRDPLLDQQINMALGSNFSLSAARQRVRAARAIARREASDFYPDVNGVIDVDKTFGPGRDIEGYVLGFEAAYPVDLWGEIESRVDAQRLRAAATQEDYRAIALMLAAEISNTWFSIIEAKAQIRLLDEQIDTNETGLALQESRFGLGLIRSADVLRQRQLVESTLEQKAVAKSRVEVLEHQMAVLLGAMPQTASYEPGRYLPDVPPLPETGLSSLLLQRRPDVRREYLAFQAADRDLASAIADQYPRVNLFGSLLNVASRPETIFQDWFLSLGGSLVAPLIDGGQRRAEVARTSAVVDELLSRYGQATLVAFQEVEDALTRERYQRERLEHLQAQLKLAGESAERLKEQYLLEPDTDYLNVLTAITGKQRLQREVLAAQLELRVIRVSLYLALAGGFDPQPQMVTEFVVSDEIATSSDSADAANDATDEEVADDLEDQLDADEVVGAVSEDEVLETTGDDAASELEGAMEDGGLDLPSDEYPQPLDTSEEASAKRFGELLRSMESN
ncbi:TolC family protein [Allorhodopirellula solitaria]|uniref:TolC family protein n=1 Tax=Allorhodopirellula solitaria TaxID=2527987 RepID=UPI001FE2A3B1|nr:TolC family protein [Allorhodopirellula solitaria]